jgi:hypothetical protein
MQCSVLLSPAFKILPIDICHGELAWLLLPTDWEKLFDVILCLRAPTWMSFHLQSPSCMSATFVILSEKTESIDKLWLQVWNNVVRVHEIKTWATGGRDPLFLKLNTRWKCGRFASVEAPSAIIQVGGGWMGFRASLDTLENLGSPAPVRNRCTVP